MKKTACFTLIFLAASCVHGHGSEWQRVADFQAQPCEISEMVGDASSYVYSLHEIPAAVLPSDAPERHIAFGSEFGFLWDRLNPDAAYRIKAVFLSDSAERIMRVEANAIVLEQKLVLPKAQLLEREWLIPAGRLGSTHCGLAFKRIKGPNAVLSRLEVFSNDPTPLAKAPPREPALDKISFPMPQLSPRPVAVSGVQVPLISLNGMWKFNPAPPAGFERLDAAQTKDWKNIEVPGEWVMQGYVVPTNTAAAYRREFDVPADYTLMQ